MNSRIMWLSCTPQPEVEVGSPLDECAIDFKSNRIATKVMELMRSEEDAHLRHLYNVLHQIPERSILAGRGTNPSHAL
jgi:hypothetical protein